METFPTLIDPDDTFEDLVAQAAVRPSCDSTLGKKDGLAQYFAAEDLIEPRMVEVRLLQVVSRDEPSLDNIAVLKRVEAWGFAPLSLHAFLAFLGQHRKACRDRTGTTVLNGPEVNGYACVFRFYDRQSFDRDLMLFPVRRVNRHSTRIFFLWSELFAVEAVREDAQAPAFRNLP